MANGNFVEWPMQEITLTSTVPRVAPHVPLT